MPLIWGIADHSSSLMMVFYFFLFSQRPPLCLCNVLLSLIVNIGNQQTGPQPNLIHRGFYLFIFLVNEVFFCHITQPYLNISMLSITAFIIQWQR